MKIDDKMTDDALLTLIGERLAGIRLARNLTQQQLAEQAGLGLRTVQRLEQGRAATQLSGRVDRLAQGVGKKAIAWNCVVRTVAEAGRKRRIQPRVKNRFEGFRETTEPRSWIN